MKNYIKAGGSSKIGNYIKAVASGPLLDPDAAAFLTAASITDNTQKTAINNLVVNLKAAGIWSKMKAVYPFVGGTATTHKWNLKDPQDTDAAFRLVFNGGMTHSSNGIQFGGVNGYADTKLNMSSNYTANDNTHISFYSRTASANSSDFEMGVFNGTTTTAITLRRADVSNQSLFVINFNAYITYIDSNAAAFYISNRLGTDMNGWRNSTKVTSSVSTAITRPSLNMFIGNLNTSGSPNPGLWSSRQCAFASIGDGLTDTEAADFYTAVQAFNTTLSRQV